MVYCWPFQWFRNNGIIRSHGSYWSYMSSEKMLRTTVIRTVPWFMAFAVCIHIVIIFNLVALLLTGLVIFIKYIFFCVLNYLFFRNWNLTLIPNIGMFLIFILKRAEPFTKTTPFIFWDFDKHDYWLFYV